MSLVRLLLFIEKTYGLWIPEGEITGTALSNARALAANGFRACFMSGNPHLNGSDYLMLGFRSRVASSRLRGLFMPNRFGTEVGHLPCPASRNDSKL